jgi:hypothetical protein
LLRHGTVNAELNGGREYDENVSEKRFWYDFVMGRGDALHEPAKRWPQLENFLVTGFEKRRGRLLEPVSVFQKLGRVEDKRLR